MGVLIYGGGGAYIRTRFCVSNINHLLTLFLYNTSISLCSGGLIFGMVSVSKLVGLYLEGLIFGMVSVSELVGLYRAGLIFGGLR